MSKHHATPQPEKVKLIQDLLASPNVNFYWFKLLGLGNRNAPFKEREAAFQDYAKARDEFLGLPPLNKPVEKEKFSKTRYAKA